MAVPKLTAEEKAYFETPPEDTPLDETEGDRTPHEDDEPEIEVGEDAKAVTPDKAEPTKKPAAKPEDKPAAKDAKKPEGEKKPETERQKTVPHGAFEAERQKRKSVEAPFEQFRLHHAEK